MKEILEAQADAQRRGVLNMWVIYDHPKDFPEGHVARRFELDQVTGDIIIGQLDALRKNFIRCGLVCLTRDPSDDPVIVETWL
jgi:hypothetical protein